MPIGYLVTTVLAAACTFFAVSPLRRSRSLGLLSWRLGLVPNELPFLVFYYLLLSTLLALGQRDIDSPVGWLAFAVAVLAAVGLAVIAWRGLRARPVVEQAMADALGADWRASLDPVMADGLRRRRPLANILLTPFLVRRRDVERLADISYGDAGVRNQLDVYRHRSHPTGGPTLIYFHGGGYSSGHKDRESRPLLYRLASQGWVCVSANYRLSPAAVFPDHLIDAKKVIAWVREHGHEYGADPGVLFVAGSSAGGHLASMAALTANDLAFQPGFESADTSVTAAITLYAYYGAIGGRDTAASPASYLGPDAPPFFVAHGDQDSYVPVETARRFVDRLRASSTNAVVYAELPGGQHSFDLFHSLRFEAVVDGIEGFAAWVRSHEGRH